MEQNINGMLNAPASGGGHNPMLHGGEAGFAPSHRDPCNPEHWAGVRLSYSNHACRRLAERELPTLDHLPPDARLVDVNCGPSGVSSAIFKVFVDEVSLFLVLSAEGQVITAWKHSKKHAGLSAHLKQRRRQRESRGC